MRIDNTTYSKLRLIGIAALAVLGLVLIGFTIKTVFNTNKVVMPEPINPLEGRVLPHLDHSAKDSITSPTEDLLKPV